MKLNCKDFAFQLGQFGKDYDKSVDLLVIVFLIRRVGVVSALDGIETDLPRH